MSRKNNLLSIGDVAKFTGAGIRALHYYERIKILEPAFIDPETNYRYYSFDQIYFIEVIMICLELDIPLKELSRFILEDKTIDYSALLAYGKGIAEEKIKNLKRGLKFIVGAEKNIALIDSYQKCPQTYTREISKKFIFAVPFEQPFDSASQQDVDRAFLTSFNSEYSDGKNVELLEYGFFCEYTSSGVKRYVFLELPKHKTNRSNKSIPHGIYYCEQFAESHVEKAATIFSEQLRGADSFLAIETYLIANRRKLDCPMRELRVIPT